MTNIKIIPATFEDILLVTGNKALSLQYQEHQDWPAYLGTRAIGEKIFVCGVIILYSGVGEAWSFLTSAGKKLIAVPKTIRDIGQMIMDKWGLWRMQATVVPELTHWIEYQGFEREGLMRKHGPNGEDQYLYSIVR